MPIHYERKDEHIFQIVIDRPQTKNALDLHHFRDLAAAWRAFKDDDDAWVAIVSGVGRNFMVGADLKPISSDYRAAAEDRTGRCKRDRWLPTLRRYLRGASQRQALQAGDCCHQWALCGGWDGDAWRGRHSRSNQALALRRHGAQARSLCRRRHNGTFAPAAEFSGRHGVSSYGGTFFGPACP